MSAKIEWNYISASQCKGQLRLEASAVARGTTHGFLWLACFLKLLILHGNLCQNLSHWYKELDWYEKLIGKSCACL